MFKIIGIAWQLAPSGKLLVENLPSIMASPEAYITISSRARGSVPSGAILFHESIMKLPHHSKPGDQEFAPFLLELDYFNVVVEHPVFVTPLFKITVTP